MPLSTTLRLEIITLLLPLSQMQREDSRHALLTTAFGNNPPTRLISYSGATATFVPLLVHTLDGFGDFEPGLPALARLLQTLRDTVGVNVQSEIDTLLTQIMTSSTDTRTSPDPSSATAASPSGSPEVASPRRLFISYRHTEPDRTLAHTLADALKEAGHSAFIDTGIRWGEDWAKRINDALKECDFLVLLLSHESAQSEMVAEEVSIAAELRRKAREVNQTDRPIILPIRIRYPFSDALPYELSAKLRHIQQVEWNDESDTARILNLLLQTVGTPGEWQGDTEPQGNGSGRPNDGDAKPQPQVDPRILRGRPGGPIIEQAPYYMERSVDKQVLEAVLADRGLATIVGARQTGKTSLLLRTMTKVQDAGLRSALVDFQSFDEEDFANVGRVWRRIVQEWTLEMNLQWTPDEWREGSLSRANLDGFLRNHLFAADESGVLLCFDEADHVLTHPIGSKFFADVRAVWSRGARDTYWGRIRFLISASTEPAFYISNLSMSPFNIGEREETVALTREQVRAMGVRFGQSQPDIERVYTFAGGQPYLTHVLFRELAQGRLTDDAIFSTRNGGIFREHLHRFLLRFQNESELGNAMRDVVNNNGCDTLHLARRLELAGLAKPDETGKCIPACDLYAIFYREALA